MGQMPFSNQPNKEIDEANDHLYELDDQKDYKPNYMIEKDGTIHFNFKYLANDTEDLNASINIFKNALRIESPMELIAIQTKSREMKSIIAPKKKKNEYEEFIMHLQDHYLNYLDCLNVLFKDITQLYISSHDFLISCLKKKQLHSFNQEIDNCSYLVIKSRKTYEDFHKFTTEYNYIAQLKDNMRIKNQSTINQIIDVYKKNEVIIKSQFNFADEYSFKAFINTLNHIVEFLDSKNDLLKKYIEVIEKVNMLYTCSLKLGTRAQDCLVVIKELYEYFYLIIKHRLVRHIELRLKEINHVAQQFHNDKNIFT